MGVNVVQPSGTDQGLDKMLDRPRGSKGWGRSRNCRTLADEDREIVAPGTIGGGSGLTKCSQEGQGRRHANGAILENIPDGSQLPGKIRRACSGSCGRANSERGLAPNVQRVSQGVMRLSSARGKSKGWGKVSIEKDDCQQSAVSITTSVTVATAHVPLHCRPAHAWYRFGTWTSITG